MRGNSSRHKVLSGRCSTSTCSRAAGPASTCIWRSCSAAWVSGGKGLATAALQRQVQAVGAEPCRAGGDLAHRRAGRPAATDSGWPGVRQLGTSLLAAGAATAWRAVPGPPALISALSSVCRLPVGACCRPPIRASQDAQQIACSAGQGDLRPSRNRGLGSGAGAGSVARAGPRPGCHPARRTGASMSTSSSEQHGRRSSRAWAAARAVRLRAWRCTLGHACSQQQLQGGRFGALAPARQLHHGKGHAGEQQSGSAHRPGLPTKCQGCTGSPLWLSQQFHRCAARAPGAAAPVRLPGGTAACPA